MDLDDAVAIVTGAAGVMGRSIVEALAGAGAIVICVDIAEAVHGVAAAMGPTVHAAPADVIKPDEIAAVVDQTISEFRKIDVLVNNAGVFGAVGALWEMDPTTWWLDVTTNLYGPFVCCRAVLPHMIDRDAGVIVNISGGGFGAAVPGGSGYTSSKAALIRMTQTLALEVGSLESELGIAGDGHNIQVYGLEPAFVDGPMNTRVAESSGGTRWLPFVKQWLQAGEARPSAHVGMAVRRLIELAPSELTGLTFSYEDDIEQLVPQSERLRSRGLCQVAYRGPNAE